jgi:hypothetical protein
MPVFPAYIADIDTHMHGNSSSTAEHPKLLNWIAGGKVSIFPALPTVSLKGRLSLMSKATSLSSSGSF